MRGRSGGKFQSAANFINDARIVRALRLLQLFVCAVHVNANDSRGLISKKRWKVAGPLLTESLQLSLPQRPLSDDRKTKLTVKETEKINMEYIGVSVLVDCARLGIGTGACGPLPPDITIASLTRKRQRRGLAVIPGTCQSFHSLPGLALSQ